MSEKDKLYFDIRDAIEAGMKAGFELDRATMMKRWRNSWPPPKQEGAKQMADEDLLRMIEVYDVESTAYDEANHSAKRANEAALGCAARRTSAAEPLKKRCGANIPKRFLRASSGNVYEVTAEGISKIEIQGGK